MIKELFNSTGLLLLRVSFGLFMLLGHGWGKVEKYNDMVGEFSDPLGIGSQYSLIGAIGAEVGCSILLILGLGTRLAAIPLAFTMGVALFMVHGEDAWNVKERAALFLAVYVVLFFTGAGRFSFDALFKRRSRNKNAA